MTLLKRALLLAPAFLMLPFLALAETKPSTAAPQANQPSAQIPPATVPGKRLPPINSWGYQLQKVTPSEIASSPFDLVVIDYSRNGAERGRFKPAEMKAMQTKPDGSRRIVLAYLSVGEAEEYRYYWNSRWVEPAPFKDTAAHLDSGAAPSTPTAALPPPTVRIPRLVAPGWLVRENTAWSGNFLVRYWYEGWHNVIYLDDDSYLSKIQQSGFDGVYLDRVDAVYGLETDRTDAAQLMVDLVKNLAAKARGKNPSFIVVPQNGEELLRFPDYLAAIDGVAKEDLLYGNSGGGQANPPGTISNSVVRLARAQSAGLPVMVVEYLDDPALQAKAAQDLRAGGFVPYITVRSLDRLGTIPPAGAPTVQPTPPAPRAP